MDPELFDLKETKNKLTFTLKNINVSLANSLRRYIISEIPSVGFITAPYEENKSTFIKNTTRLNNEILKQRLSCIPCNITDVDDFPFDQYIIEINEKNEDTIIKYVTTEHIKIKNVLDGSYLPFDEVNKIFPPDPISNYYIDIVRLRPSISDTIKGEELHLTCNFSKVIPKIHGCNYNIVYNCTYSNTQDIVKSSSIWEKMENKLKNDNETKENIELHKNNYMAVDALKQYIENSFDYTIETIGVFTNKAILKMGLDGLSKKFIELIKIMDEDKLNIKPAVVNIDNCYDVILENEDYTLGKPIEYVLYEKYFKKEQLLTFCGFRKNHPHDKYSIIRLGFKEKKQIIDIYSIIRDACNDIIEIYDKIKSQLL